MTSRIPTDQSESRPTYVQAAEQVVSELRQMPTFNKVLRQQLLSIVAETEKAAFDIASQLQTIDQVVSEVAALIDGPPLEWSEVAAAVGKNNQLLADMFMTVLASVQFQDVTRQQIEQVIGALDRLDDHSQCLAQYLENHEEASAGFQPLAEHLDEIYAQYVMDSQRDSHRQAAEGASPGDEPPGEDKAGKVELF